MTILLSFVDPWALFVITTSRSLQVKEYYEVSAFGLAIQRLPALFITLVLELVGGVIISQLAEVRGCHKPAGSSENLPQTSGRGEETFSAS
jgi:hypothetical protein